MPAINDEGYIAGLSRALNGGSGLSIAYDLNASTTLTRTGPSSGTSLTSKAQVFMFGWQRRF